MKLMDVKFIEVLGDGDVNARYICEECFVYTDVPLDREGLMDKVWMNKKRIAEVRKR